jgi:hypothetical protein
MKYYSAGPPASPTTAIWQQESESSTKRAIAHAESWKVADLIASSLNRHEQSPRYIMMESALRACEAWMERGAWTSPPPIDLIRKALAEIS